MSDKGAGFAWMEIKSEPNCSEQGEQLTNYEVNLVYGEVDEIANRLQ